MTARKLAVGDEFTDGSFNYIVLDVDTVDWDMAPYDDGAPTACNAHEYRCDRPIRWALLDSEGCFWGACAEATVADTFFNEPCADYVLEPVDPDMTGLERLNRWRDEAAYLPIRSSKRVLDPEDIGGKP